MKRLVARRQIKPLRLTLPLILLLRLTVTVKTRVTINWLSFCEENPARLYMLSIFTAHYSNKTNLILILLWAHRHGYFMKNA